MNNYTYKVVDAPITLSFEVFEHIWLLQKRSKQVYKDEIIKYINKTPAYTSKAIKFLSELRVINVEDNLVYLSNDSYKIFDGTKDSFVNLIRGKILNFKPFIEYCYFNSKGKSKTESAKLVNRIYDIRMSNDALSKIFESWIKTFSFELETSENKFEHDEIEYVRASNNELSILKFLKEKFGEYFIELNYDVVKDLTDALSNYKVDSKSAVNDAGRALEDFLRLNFANSIDLTKCSGIGQIANELPRHNISTSKHNSIILALGQIRSMGDAHGVDMKVGDRWSVTEQLAFSYILMVISMMLSLLEYKKNQVLLF